MSQLQPVGRPVNHELHGYRIILCGRGVGKRCRKSSSIYTEIIGLLLEEPKVSNNLFDKADKWLKENYKEVHKAEIHLEECWVENFEDGGSVCRTGLGKRFKYDVQTRKLMEPDADECMAALKAAIMDGQAQRDLFAEAEKEDSQ